MENYNPFESATFTYDRCFLCGCLLDPKNYSEEHVYPKWLQHEFNLWDKELILLNNTHIKYRNLTIPCCKKCNNEHLSSKIEKPVEQAVKAGYSEFIKLNEKILFQWLNKIAYGTLFKELSLKLDRKNANSPPIYTADELKKHKMQFMFLQSIKYDTDFLSYPWSILVFKTKNKQGYYNAFDLQLTNSFYIQMHDIGIIACLMDNGTQKDFFMEHLSEFLEIEIHPVQFAELSAKVQTKLLLCNQIPYYLLALPNESYKKRTIISQPMTGQIFEPWSNELFCKMFEYFGKDWDIKFENIYIDKEFHLSYLFNEDKTIKIM